MGMSTSVIGIKPADKKFKKMYDIYANCEEMGIEIPKEVDEFFNNEEPDEKGVCMDLSSENYSCCKEYSDEMQEGYEVYVKELPKDIKIIRFVNSY